MISDNIGDILTRIRNAQMAKHNVVEIRLSNLAKSILSVLKREGMIEWFEERETTVESKKKTAGKNILAVGLKYYASGEPLISKAKRVSTPGCRIYSSCEDLPKVHSGLGMALISTSKGIMTDVEARRNNMGGELLALIS